MNLRSWQMVVVVVALIPARVIAEPVWVSVGPGSSADEFIFVDAASLKASGGTRSGWERINFGGEKGKEASYQLTHVLVQCEEGRLAIDQVLKYKKGGGPPLSSDSFMTKFAPPVPGTVGEALVEAFCKLRAEEAAQVGRACFAEIRDADEGRFTTKFESAYEKCRSLGFLLPEDVRAKIANYIVEKMKEEGRLDAPEQTRHTQDGGVSGRR